MLYAHYQLDDFGQKIKYFKIKAFYCTGSVKKFITVDRSLRPYALEFTSMQWTKSDNEFRNIPTVRSLLDLVHWYNLLYHLTSN